jgi:hypothetical protein
MMTVILRPALSEIPDLIPVVSLPADDTDRLLTLRLH